MLKREPLILKNRLELINIPNDKLFISESGYAYHTDEIKDFLAGGKTFLENRNHPDEIPGTLRDYKNPSFPADEQRDLFYSTHKISRNDAPLNLFTPKDLVFLLQQEGIASTYLFTAHA